MRGPFLNSSPCLLSPDLTIGQAIATLQQSSDSYALVVEREQLLGLVSERQIVTLAGSVQNWKDWLVADVMVQVVETLKLSELTDLPLLLERLDKSSIPYLPVVDEQGMLLGTCNAVEVWRCFAADKAELAKADPAVELQLAWQTIALLESQLRNQEQNLEQYQSRLDSILSSIEDVVWSVIPVSFQLLYINSATEKVFGRAIADFLRQLSLWQEIVYYEDRTLVEEAYQALYASGRADLEYRIVWPNQEVKWVSSRMYLIKDEHDKPLRIDGITTDITEQKSIQQKLKYNALHDGLTGLANRHLLIDRLQQSCRRNQRRLDKFIAVLFLDLDQFKVINDSLGHQIGDQILCAVAQRLHTCCRLSDTIARLGGDEFVLLLEDLDSREVALRVAQCIHEALRVPIQIDGHEIVISTSIGIAFSNLLSYGEEMIATLLRDADTAMYRAKSRGQGKHEIFDSSMHAEALKRLGIETDLRRLLTEVETSDGDSTELLVYYQPILALDSFQIEGLEALVRWQHPQKGLISPAEFVPIAEETGLIVRLDQWVIKTAYRQLSHWQRQFPSLKSLSMSVNLSGRHFETSGLIDLLDQVIQETHLDPIHLKLEITETAVVKNPQSAATVLDQLQARGIQICLDDFGTGYASLRYLQILPFQILKIDQTFTQRLGTSLAKNTKTAIAEAIINLGNTLGLGIVAEGIEEWEQVAHLKSLGCSHGQGFLFARPMSSIDATTFLLRAC